MNFPAELLTGAAGLALAAAGYPIYRISLRLAGVILGFYLGSLIGSTAGHFLKLGANQIWLTLACGLILGLLGASILRKWIKVLLFFAGFTFGIILAGIPAGGASSGDLMAVFQTVFRHLQAGNFTALVAGLLGGILGIFLERAVIIALTSFVGACLVNSAYPHPWLMGLIVIAGVLSQTLIFKRA